MCRVVGYLGAPTPIATVVTDPPHSLRAQARAPRELPPGMLGSDGYGIAWYSGVQRAPARYRQTLPIWTDPNLDTLVPHVMSSCFVGSTRTAAQAMPVSLTNTPPFCFGDAMFVHNGSVDDFHAKLIEPLRYLFKDEARAVGTELGLPDEIVWRDPFPGPGLAVRVLGEVKKEYCDLLRRADAIFIEELRKADLYNKVSQAFTVFLPVRSAC